MRSRTAYSRRSGRRTPVKFQAAPALARRRAVVGAIFIFTAPLTASPVMPRRGRW